LAHDSSILLRRENLVPEPDFEPNANMPTSNAMIEIMSARIEIDGTAHLIRYYHRRRSFVAQRGERIDLGCAASGDIAGQHRNTSQ
jgi:hypothetical protein